MDLKRQSLIASFHTELSGVLENNDLNGTEKNRDSMGAECSAGFFVFGDPNSLYSITAKILASFKPTCAAQV